MSHSNHFLAIVPLLAVLSASPAQLQNKYASRSIASEIEATFPKYEARASKIDRTKIELDKEIDLTKFSAKGDEFRKKLLQERKDYKVDEVKKEAVAEQKKRLQDLVQGLVVLEEDVKLIQEKKLWDAEGEKIALGTMKEMKTTLESLLQDEIENELAVLKEENRLREQAAQATPAPTPAAPAEPAKPEKDPLLCQLEEQNKDLNKKITDLMSEQKKILDALLGVTQVMVQMNQRQQQQQPQVPYYMNGPMVSPQISYPSVATQGNGQWVFYPNGFNPSQAPQQVQQPQMNYQQSQPEMGSQTLQQQSQQFMLPQPSYYQDPRFNMQQYPVGNFGDQNFMYNFGETIFNVPPQASPVPNPMAPTMA